MKRPCIKTALPGPRASKLISVDKLYVSPSYTRSYPLVADKGRGVWLHDVDGNEFLDFTAGIAVCSTGHCHPTVVQAIKKQAERLIHMSGTDFYYTPQIALAEKLAVPTLFVECHASDDVVRQRLSHRQSAGQDPSDARWEVYLDQKRRFEKVTEIPAQEHVVLDTQKPIDELLAQVKQAVYARFAFV